MATTPQNSQEWEQPKNKTQQADHFAEKVGQATDKISMSVMAVFARGGAVILLIITAILLIHVEAQQSADIINLPNQYWKSLALSTAAALFGMLGFTFLFEAWKAVAVRKDADNIMKAQMKASYFQIYRDIIVDNLRRDLIAGVIFTLANIGLTVLIILTSVSSIDHLIAVKNVGALEDTVFYYTLAISVLAMVIGAAISYITPARKSEMWFIEKTNERISYLAKAKAVSEADFH